MCCVHVLFDKGIFCSVHFVLNREGVRSVHFLFNKECIGSVRVLSNKELFWNTIALDHTPDILARIHLFLNTFVLERVRS